MKWLYVLLVAVVVVAMADRYGRGERGQPSLVEHGKVLGDSPTSGIIVRRGDAKIVSWPAMADRIPVWCFKGALAFADVDGVFWAVDGLAMRLVRTHDMFLDGKRQPIRDYTETAGATRTFLYDLGYRMSAAGCS